MMVAFLDEGDPVLAGWRSDQLAINGEEFPKSGLEYSKTKELQGQKSGTE